MVRAIGLLSGGLDSTLAIKLMLEQGIEVFALNFVTPFCTCTKKGCRHQATKVAEAFNISLKIILLREEYIEIIKGPKYGYGKNMNPCIDCRIFMFSKAREYMMLNNAAFIFTGEVLGERPMSQRKAAMHLIEKEAGLELLILRPLSAKLLPPTIPEIKGYVDRKHLLGIKGRSRKPQIKLVEAYGIEDYLCPAGGCRLTDPNYARRLKEALFHNEDTMAEINLLRYGRHFRLPSGAKVIIGRNQEENMILQRIAKDNDIIAEALDIAGPLTILKKKKKVEDLELTAALTLSYSDYQGAHPWPVKLDDKIIMSVPKPREAWSSLMI